MKKTITTKSRSTINAEEMLLANIPWIVAIGWSHNKTLPVSTETIITNMLGAMNPATASIK